MVVGGISGAVFSVMFGFYTASLGTPRVPTGYSTLWVNKFGIDVVTKRKIV